MTLIYSPSYVVSHPAKFLNMDWVDIQELKEFTKHQSPQISQSVVSTGGSSVLRCPSPPDANLVHVKPKADACFLPDLTTPIKKEPRDVLDLSFNVSDI